MPWDCNRRFWRLGELSQAVIAGTFAVSFPFQVSFCNQLAQSSFDRTDAERRAEFPNILFGKTADFF